MRVFLNGGRHGRRGIWREVLGNVDEIGVADSGGREETSRMKVILLLWGLVAFACAQVVVPEKGWRKIGEGKGKVAGLKTLGVWDNTDDGKGDVVVGVAWGRKPPTFRQLLGLKPGDVASGDLIQRAEILEKPRLGWLIQYRGRKKSNGSRQRNYWIYGKDGGVLVQAIHDKDAGFSLEGWNAEGIPEDEDGRKRKEIKEMVDAMNATKALPKIKIDIAKNYIKMTKC